jgi:hypothetical protein
MRRSVVPIAVLIAILVAAPACSGNDDAPGAEAADTSSQATVPTDSIYFTGDVRRRTASGDEWGMRGVTVVMRPQRGGKEVRMLTGLRGEFSKRGMPPGTYDVSVEGLQPGQKFAPIEFTVPATSYNVLAPHLVVSES